MFRRGAPEGTRTPNLLVRSQTLYPVELPARIYNRYYYTIIPKQMQVFFKKKLKFLANCFKLSEKAKKDTPRSILFSGNLIIHLKYGFRKSSEKCGHFEYNYFHFNNSSPKNNHCYIIFREKKFVTNSVKVKKFSGVLLIQLYCLNRQYQLLYRTIRSYRRRPCTVCS